MPRATEELDLGQAGPLTLHRQHALRGGRRHVGRLRVLQQLLAQDVAEEDPDERDPPQELQLLGDQGHGLIEPGQEQESGHQPHLTEGHLEGWLGTATRHGK